MNRLYHNPLSPFSGRCALALAEKRIEVELVEERYWEQDPDFLRGTPRARSPSCAWQPHLADSPGHLRMLEETVPTPPLLPHDPDARYEVRRLCAWFDGKFHREVTTKLMGERVFKKLRGGGVPTPRPSSRAPGHQGPPGLHDPAPRHPPLARGATT
jgi:glutathione S-transferase